MKTVLCLLIISLTSCRLPPQGGKLAFEEIKFSQPAEALNFNKIKTDIIEPYCIQCHPGYANVTQVKDEVASILDSVLSNRMPKESPSLDTDLKNLLTQWVQAGAPVDSPIPSKPVLSPTWNSLSQLVFFPKCVQCHNPNGEASFLDLSSYKSFVANKDYILNSLENGAESYLVEVITDPDEPMPPQWAPIEPVSQKEVSTIIEWINLKIPEK